MSVLANYLPQEVIPYIENWIQEFKLDFKIVNPRKTKFGDFRPAYGSRKKHQITINNNLNKHAFLITTLHEFAHLFTWEEHGRRVQPHGVEWKSIFAEMLVKFYPLFPEDVQLALEKYIDNPKASSCSDKDLYKVLRKYDEYSQPYLDEISIGSEFLFNKKRYQSLEKRRTRYIVKNLHNGREYLISGIAQVEPVK